MDRPESEMAKEVALAACDFERRRTGHSPKSVTVVLSENLVVITLHGVVGGRAGDGQEPGRRPQVQEFHRQLFDSSADSLRQEIRWITGVDVREAAVESSRQLARSSRRLPPAPSFRCSCSPMA